MFNYPINIYNKFIESKTTKMELNNIGVGFKLTQDEINKIRKVLSKTTGELSQFKSSLIKFDPDIHNIFSFNSKKMDYFGRQTDKTKHKWGQMKLFVGLLEFLTLFYDSEKYQDPKLVYVGAAPGQGITLIVDMFQKFKFYLYDSQAFDKKLVEKAEAPESRVTLYQRYFEEADAEYWATQKDVFFVSDIRSLGYNVEMGRVTQKGEEIVWGDMQLQESWVKKIKPAWSQLKFRPPYYDEITKKMFEGYTFSYLSGIIFYQSFAGASSSETRLVVNGERIVSAKYDYRNYEKVVMYHNSIIRELEFTKFYSPLSIEDKILEIRNRGIIPNWDITKFLWLIKVYLTKVGKLATEQLVLNIIYKIDSFLIERGILTRESKGFAHQKKLGLAEIAKIV